MNHFSSAIYIAGVARSGTSWIGQIFNSCPVVRFRFQPLFAYEFKNQVNEDSSAAEFRELLKGMYESYSEFLQQEDKMATGEYPRFSKENESILSFKENRYQSLIEPMMRKIPELKFLGVVRHPCAVLNSWRKNIREFPPECDIRKEWRFGNCKNKGNEDYFGYYKWKEIAHLYLDLKDKYPSRTYVVKYEDLVHNPMDITTEIFDFFGVPMTEQTREFLDASTSTCQSSYYSVYKTADVTDQWKTEFDPYISAEIHADLAKTRLDVFVQ